MSYEHLAFHPFPFSCKTPSPPLPSPLSTRVLAGGGEIVIASCLRTPPSPLSDQQHHHHRRRRRWLHHLHDDYQRRRLPPLYLINSIGVIFIVALVVQQDDLSHLYWDRGPLH